MLKYLIQLRRVKAIIMISITILCVLIGITSTLLFIHSFASLKSSNQHLLLNNTIHSSTTTSSSSSSSSVSTGTTTTTTNTTSYVCLVFTLLLLFSVYTYIIPTLYFTPYSLNVCIVRIFLETIMGSYQSLSRFKITEKYGLYFHNYFLEDVSPTSKQLNFNRIRFQIEILKKFENKINVDLANKKPGSLQQWISYNTITWFLSTSLMALSLKIYLSPLYIYHPTIFPLNPSKGYIVALRQTLFTTHTLNDKRDIEAYISRLFETESYVSGIIKDIKARVCEGILAPEEIIKKVNLQILELAEVEDIIKPLNVGSTLDSPLKSSPILSSSSSSSSSTSSSTSSPSLTDPHLQTNPSTPPLLPPPSPHNFSKDAKSHMLYKRLYHKLYSEPLQSKLPEKVKNSLLDQCRTAISEHFIPSLLRLSQYLESICPLAPKEIGLWNLPNNGDEIYRFSLYYYTSTNMHPMDIVESGYSEISRIQHSIIDLMSKDYPFDSEYETFGQYINRILDKECLNFDESEEGEEETFREIDRVFKDHYQDIESVFDLPPMGGQSLFDIQYVKSDFNSGVNSFLYVPPPANNKERAKIYIDFNKALGRSKVMIKSLSLLEGVPGHHLQLLASRKENIDIFRRNFMNFSSYEGWGHYAESLSVELNWIKDKWGKLGHYISDLRLTATMIADCSMHYSGIKWGYDKCLSFLVDSCGFEVNDAKLNIDSIASLPGIGLSGKIGSIKIKELRGYCEQQMKDRFDIKKFHNIILKNGALPLDILYQVINYWISEQQQQLQLQQQQQQ